jgi:hypothetical protein
LVQASSGLIPPVGRAGVECPRRPPELGELGVEPVLQREQVFDVGRRVLLLGARERTPEPIGQPIALGRGLAQLTLHEDDERRRGVADEARRDLGVVEVTRNCTGSVGEHVEVLLGGVEHGQGVGLEQLPQQAWIDGQRVDEGDVGLPLRVVPRELDECELREIRAFAVELGIDRVPRQRDQLIDEG